MSYQCTADSPYVTFDLYFCRKEIWQPSLGQHALASVHTCQVALDLKLDDHPIKDVQVVQSLDHIRDWSKRIPCHPLLVRQEDWTWGSADRHLRRKTNLNGATNLWFRWITFLICIYSCSDATRSSCDCTGIYTTLCQRFVLHNIDHSIVAWTPNSLIESVHSSCSKFLHWECVSFHVQFERVVPIHTGLQVYMIAASTALQSQALKSRYTGTLKDWFT